jgi:hypothetical protein
MRRISLLSGVVLAAAFASGCSYAMRPVVFDAPRADWESWRATGVVSTPLAGMNDAA